jgi:hypothetical protein
MPLYKYIANRALTFFENVALGQNLGDFHSGFRAYRREVLETIPYELNSDDFVFDSQFLAQAVSFGFKLGDIPVPVRYFPEASSINFRRSLKYGLTTVKVMGDYWLNRLGFSRNRLFVDKRSGSSPSVATNASPATQSRSGTPPTVDGEVVSQDLNHCDALEPAESLAASESPVAV